MRSGHSRKFLGRVEAKRFVKSEVLELDVQSRAIAYELDSLFHRRHALSDINRFGGKRIRSIEPRACVEPLDLREGKVDGIPARFRFAGFFRIANRRSLGKYFSHVRRASEVGIMQTDQHAVFCDLQVLLDEIRALLNSGLVPGERVFGRVSGSPSMRD